MTPEPLGFPAVWLRHNCPCPDCRDPVTGQRLLKITDIRSGLVATVTAQRDTEIVVTFAADGHRSVFRRDWLAAQAAEDPDPRTEDGKVLWQAADLPAPHTADWGAYTSDDLVREGCLDAVARYGCALLRRVPASPGMVLDVAAAFGYVRETNYGKLFDVRVEPDPANLAFTSREIAPHTDNPYRDPVPTVQLLHCLRSAADGGESVFADGFRAAAQLRVRDPAAFRTLAGTPVTFSYRDQSTQLSATRPLIGLDPRGRIREIRCNGRSLQPPGLNPAAWSSTTPGSCTAGPGSPARAAGTCRAVTPISTGWSRRWPWQGASERKGRTGHDIC